jgi:hypothetical protein
MPGGIGDAQQVVLRIVAVLGHIAGRIRDRGQAIGIVPSARSPRRAYFGCQRSRKIETLKTARRETNIPVEVLSLLYR